MSFDADRILLATLLTIELPSKTIRLCDGAFVYWGADTFTSEDEDFGSLQAADPGEEVAGDEAPSARVVFLPSDSAAVADLSSPDFQGSSFKLWLAVVDPETATVTGTPELIFDGIVDEVELVLDSGTRILEMTVASAAEKLFRANDGNVLSDRFHQSVWPGEKGFSNATGAPVPVPWGTEGPPRGTANWQYSAGSNVFRTLIGRGAQIGLGTYGY